MARIDRKVLKLMEDTGATGITLERTVTEDQQTFGPQNCWRVTLRFRESHKVEKWGAFTASADSTTLVGALRQVRREATGQVLRRAQER